MTKSMRKTGTAIAAMVAASVAMTVGVVSPASALGGETFGCRIAPGTTFTFQQSCMNDPVQASQYNVGFAVQNLSGSGYTFSWTITGQYVNIYTGCTATSSDCAVFVRGGNFREISATVTYTQGGVSASQTAYAEIEPVCGNQYC